MMLRAASRVADRLNLPAVVTGESVAQVASQTITNLAVIDKVSDHMVLRPLAAMDKPEIIDISRRIGTESFAATMPEYCGVISVRPTTVGDLAKVEKTVQEFDFSVLEAALDNAKVERIDDVLDGEESGLENVQLVSTPAIDDVVVDIRHPSEVEDAPLHLTNNDVLTIPFYELDNKVSELESGKRHLLYCQKGTMSKIHAHHLNAQEKGNFAVLIG